MRKNEKLKPCPFCGGTPKLMKTMDESLWSHEVVPYHKVWCEECEIGTEFTCEGYEPTALQAWNKRAPKKQKKEQT